MQDCKGSTFGVKAPMNVLLPQDIVVLKEATTPGEREKTPDGGTGDHGRQGRIRDGME